MFVRADRIGQLRATPSLLNPFLSLTSPSLLYLLSQSGF